MRQCEDQSDSAVQLPIAPADPGADAAAEETAPNPLKSLQCEGGDLNPYAHYGASTSTIY